MKSNKANLKTNNTCVPLLQEALLLFLQFVIAPHLLCVCKHTTKHECSLIIKSKQNKTKQNKTKQNKTKQNKTKQNKTKQKKTKQNKTKQNKTKQNKTKQNKTTQNKTVQL